MHLVVALGLQYFEKAKITQYNIEYRLQHSLFFTFLNYHRNRLFLYFLVNYRIFLYSFEYRFPTLGEWYRYCPSSSSLKQQLPGNCEISWKKPKELYFFAKEVAEGKEMIITESLTKRRLQLLEAARDVFGWSPCGHLMAMSAHSLVEKNRLLVMLMTLLKLKIQCNLKIFFHQQP